jgi:hypothetical protein
MEITCPSGLRGSVRGMRVKELGDMSDSKLLRSGKIIDRLVSTCWEKTLSPGPYTYTTDALPWESMLQGDRAWAFLALRMATFGSEYAFEHICTNEMCKFKYDCVVQLDTLKQKSLPKTSYAHVHDNAQLVTKVAGKTVSFRLLRCSDDQRLRYLTEQQKLSFPVAQIVTRIVEVEGIEGSDLESIAGWIEGLGMAEGLTLRETMEEADCGVEMEITTVCPNPRCGNTESFDLPLGSGFFQTKRTKKDSKSSETNGLTQ